MNKKQLRAQISRELKTAQTLRKQAFCVLYRCFLDSQIIRLTAKVDELKPTPRVAK